jgi:drug/metabolite transporter (DMT)-like permease
VSGAPADPETGSAASRWRALSPAIRGCVWMFLSTFAFAAMVGFVREASNSFNAFEVTFWRALFGLAFMIPWLVRVRLRGLGTARAGLHLTRNIVHFIGIIAWFYVVERINLSVGIALQFTVPLFTIVMAAAILKERVDAARWTATAIGFAGILVIVRPDTGAFDALAAITLVSAAFYAGSNIATKAIGRADSSEVVVFYMHLMHVPMALAGALAFGMSVPGWADLPVLAGVAVCATLAHYLLAQALREADASVIMPIDFLRLPWTASLAYVLFGETPLAGAWIGGAVIFVATYYILRREARAGRPRP